MEDIENLTDLSAVLRTLAARSPAAVAAGLTEAAAQLDLAVNLANRHGDRDLQDMLQAALGHAELGVVSQLRQLLQEVGDVRDVGKDTHILTQGIHNDLRQFTETSGQRFAALEGRFSDLDESVSQISTDVEGLKVRMDDSARDRGGLHGRVESLEAQLAARPSIDETRRLVAVIGRLEHIMLSNEQRQAGASDE